MFLFWNLWAASVLRTFSVSTNIRTFKAISNPSFLTSISPESDTRVGEETKQEASSDARQEGGGQHNITSQSQSSPQCHTPGIHVDGAGRLLHHALHRFTSTCRWWGRTEIFFYDSKNVRLLSGPAHLQHLKANRQVFSFSIFPPHPPVLLLQTDQHLLLFGSHLKHELIRMKSHF